MTTTPIYTMKIYEVSEHTIEDNIHEITGIFSELALAQSLNPMNGTELVIIKELSLHDGQFFPTGSTYAKQIEIVEKGNAVWSEWLEIYNKPL